DAEAVARRALAEDGGRACEARDFADYRAPTVVLCCPRRVCYACGMIQPKPLLAPAAALAASSAYARPRTATDIHSMRRIGAPDVSSDGKWAVFTVSTTDSDKDTHVNSWRLDNM